MRTSRMMNARQHTSITLGGGCRASMIQCDSEETFIFKEHKLGYSTVSKFQALDNSNGHFSVETHPNVKWIGCLLMEKQLNQQSDCGDSISSFFGYELQTKIVKIFQVDSYFMTTKRNQAVKGVS